MFLTEMDLVRGILASAMAEGMDLSDLYACAEHADELWDFDVAVNLLAQTCPADTITPKALQSSD